MVCLIYEYESYAHIYVVKLFYLGDLSPPSLAALESPLLAGSHAGRASQSFRRSQIRSTEKGSSIEASSTINVDRSILLRRARAERDPAMKTETSRMKRVHASVPAAAVTSMDSRSSPTDRSIVLGWNRQGLNGTCADATQIRRHIAF
jgi:hypothetical protein